MKLIFIVIQRKVSHENRDTNRTQKEHNFNDLIKSTKTNNRSKIDQTFVVQIKLQLRVENHFSK